MASKVVLVTTGGTIASRMDSTHGDIRANASGADLVAGLPDIPDGLAIEVVEFCRINSFAMDLETGFGLTRCIETELARADVTGVVVTHGTDTLEESAFLADILIASDKSVVFTGAQRGADAPDRDGPANIANSAIVAASPAARGLGALVCFDEEIHAARDATKTHTSRVGTFQSAEHGKIGDVDGGQVIIHREPRLRRHIETSRLETNVELIKLSMGMDGKFLRCALDSGAKGLVIEAFGRGNVTPDILVEIRNAVARDIPVVITSRAPQGRVKPIYGAGGGKDVHEAGALFAGDLSGIKARLLLGALLGSGCERATLNETITFFAG